jgi:hypothetical protein
LTAIARLPTFGFSPSRADACDITEIIDRACWTGTNAFHTKIAFFTIDDVVVLVTYRFRWTTCFARIAANARFRIDEMLLQKASLPARFH